MTNVQFENEDFIQFRNPFDRPRKGLVGLLIKLGIAKDEKEANVVLIGVIIACLVIILFWIFVVNKNGSSKPPISKEKIRAVMQLNSQN